jgi:hypothetical protein
VRKWEYRISYGRLENPDPGVAKPFGDLVFQYLLVQQFDILHSTNLCSRFQRESACSLCELITAPNENFVLLVTLKIISKTY